MTPPVAGPARDDSAVVIPARLAGDVARLLGRALVHESRTTGAPVTPGTVTLLRALDAAARRHAEIRTSATTSVCRQENQPLSTLEAAGVLGVSSRWIRWLCHTGTLRAQRDGKAWQIDRADLDAYRRTHDDRDRDGPQPLHGGI